MVDTPHTKASISFSTNFFAFFFESLNTFDKTFQHI
jgi:hypothetical protein